MKKSFVFVREGGGGVNNCRVTLVFQAFIIILKSKVSSKAVISPWPSYFKRKKVIEIIKFNGVGLQYWGSCFCPMQIELKTVRPFVIDEINLENCGYLKNDANADEVRHDVEKFLCKRMEKLIRDAERSRGPNQPKEPLVRLRVEFGNVEPLNPILFGQKFFGRVANPKDIILPMKSKPHTQDHLGLTRTNSEMKPLILLDTTTIEDIVKDHFEKHAENFLQLFDARFLTESLRQFVHNVRAKSVGEILLLKVFLSSLFFPFIFSTSKHLFSILFIFNLSSHFFSHFFKYFKLFFLHFFSTLFLIFCNFYFFPFIFLIFFSFFPLIFLHIQFFLGGGEVSSSYFFPIYSRNFFST